MLSFWSLPINNVADFTVLSFWSLSINHPSIRSSADQKLSIAKHSGIVDREGIIPPHQQWWHCWPGGIIPSPSTMPGRSLEGVWFPRVQNKCLTTARQESSPIIPYIYQTRKYSREPGMITPQSWSVIISLHHHMHTPFIRKVYRV